MIIPTPATFVLLVVCTGNICRSPAVERLLAAGLGPDSGVRVHSAGTGALAGHAISPPMVRLITAAGGAGDGFTARQVTTAMVREAGLVLTLTRDHRSRVVNLYPGAVRRTFTLRELGRLVRELDPTELPTGPPAERLVALVPLASARRGRHPVAPAEDDVTDPYRRSERVYTSVFAQIQEEADAVLRLARG